MRKCYVTFEGREGRIPVEPGVTVMEVAREHGIAIPSICGGKGKCKKCLVRISGCKEAQLACQYKIYEDIFVAVPDLEKNLDYAVDKKIHGKSVELNAAVKNYTINSNTMDFEEEGSKWEWIKEELVKKYAVKLKGIDYPALQKLSKSNSSLSIPLHLNVWKSSEVIDVSDSSEVYGIAVDIGSTTIAAYLCDLETGSVIGRGSTLNPQVAFGEDILSRITYCLTHDSGVVELQKGVIDAINNIIDDVCREARVSNTVLKDMVVVGNTCMIHLLLGLDVASIGTPPFKPSFRDVKDIKARDLGIRINRGAYVHLLPLIAGFIGSDTSATILSEKPHESNEVILIIDAGTNGELVLGNRERILCASCATGPALEGGCITYGMRAAPGAIESVSIDNATKEVTYTVIPERDPQGGKRELKPRGICGSGIIDCVAQMYLAGLIDESGAMKKDCATPRLIEKDGEASFILAWAWETDGSDNIVVTQSDIRAVQMAKGAIQAASIILMNKMGVTGIDRIILAGAFGSVINVDSASVLGFFPDCPVNKIEGVGNAAGEGARIALLNIQERSQIQEVVKKVEHVNLVSEETFQKQFAYAIHIPRMLKRNQP